MDCQMRFGEDDSAGHPGRLSSVVEKPVKQLANHGQAVTTAGASAKRCQPVAVEQRGGRALTIPQIGEQMKTLHAVIVGRLAPVARFT